MPDRSFAYRVVVYDTTGPQPARIGQADGDAFHIITGYHQGEQLQGQHATAGDPHLLQHLADLIADNPTGSQPR